VPYLTPQELPEDDDCRPLSIPANSEWLALFGGALTELTKSWNWEYSGGLTVDETVNKMMEIVNNWYIVPCGACTTPGGYRVIRIGTSGRVEELDENGDWVDATDEYHIPPPDAREGGTADDRKCLAAKNAVNVLEQLYESLSDSWNAELETDAALLALAGAFTSAVGFVIAPITFGIAAFFLPIFLLAYKALEFLTQDLWDEAVTDQLVCILKGCAVDEGGVVTFDYDCFWQQLNEQVNAFALTDLQLRLYAQIIYILYFIGGADGLNLAGGTTAITDDDCTDCACDVFLEATAGGGVVENLGGNHWRVTSTHGVHDSFGVISVDEVCWGYCNFVVNYGAGDYANFTNCFTHSVVEGFPADCNGEGGTGENSNDIIALYIQGDAGEFQVEFDVYCHPCEGECM